MTSEQIIKLVIVISAVDLVVVGGLVIWMIRRSGLLAGQIEDSAIRSGERFLMPPQSAMYNGSLRNFGKVKGNGTIALTVKRLIFHKIIGGVIDIPFADIESVSDDVWFMGSFRSFRKHLILTLKDGNKVGFMVKDHEEWMRRIRESLRNQS